MFVRVERRTLPIDERGIGSVMMSSNHASLAVPGLDTESAIAYVVEHVNDRQLHNAFVYILLEQSRTPVIYVSQAPPVPARAFAALRAEAIAFVESMGFFMAEVNPRPPLWPFLQEHPKVHDAAEEASLVEIQPEALDRTEAMSQAQRKAWARFLASFCFLLFAACAGEVSEKDKTDARIQYDVGVEQLSKANFSGALQAFSISERLDNQFADVHNALGLVNYAMSRNDEARKHYQRALELRPEWSEVHNNFGILLIALGDYDGAISHFKIALKDVLYDSPSHAEGNMGYAYFKKGERATALKHIKNATLVNPKFCRGYLWLGEIYQSSAELRDAERYLDRFVERCLLDGNLKNTIDAAARSEVYMRLGQVTLAQGQVGRAAQAFQTCVDAGRDTPCFDTCARSLRDLQAR